MAKKSSSKKGSAQSTEKSSIAALRAENEALKAKLEKFEDKEVIKSKKRSKFWRSLNSGILAFIAVICFTLFNISYWVTNTIVDTNQFVATMQPLIKDPDIQKTLKVEITNQIFSQIDIEAELQKALPQNLQFIAGPFASQVESFTSNKIGDVLASDQAYAVWTKALESGHAQIIAYIQDPNTTGKITVNSIYDLASENLKDSGIGFLLGKNLPDSVGNIELANIEGAPKARQAINYLQQLTTALAVATVVAGVLAVAISPRRRNMIIGLAVSTFVLMLVTLGSLLIAGSRIGGLVEPQFASAAESVQQIVTAPLVAQTQGVAALIGSIIIIAIISSNWPSLVWMRSKVRQGLDWVSKKLVGGWGGSQYITWVATNRIVICWTLVAVSFAAFALRIPPTFLGVKEALAISALAALCLEVVASVSRVTKK